MTTTTNRTLTTAQVHQLRREASSAGDMIQVVICDVATDEYDADEGLEAYDGLHHTACARRLEEIGITVDRDGTMRATSGSVAESAESLAWAECARVIAETETQYDPTCAGCQHDEPMSAGGHHHR